MRWNEKSPRWITFLNFLLKARRASAVVVSFLQFPMTCAMEVVGSRTKATWGERKRGGESLAFLGCRWMFERVTGKKKRERNSLGLRSFLIIAIVPRWVHDTMVDDFFATERERTRHPSLSSASIRAFPSSAPLPPGCLSVHRDWT